MSKISKWNWGKIFIVSLLFSIIFGMIALYYSNRVYSDTTGWVDASMDQKDPQIIVQNLQNAKSGLTKWNAISGNAYLLYGTPASDMEEVAKNLDSYINQAETLVGLDRSSQEYQDGLSNLSDSLSNLYLYADEYWLRHNGIAIFLISNIVDFISIISFILMIAFYFSNKNIKVEKK